MKKIDVNKSACIGCGACVAIDNQHFAFDEKGLSSVKNNEDLESPMLQEAIDSCPTSAISLIQANETTCTNDEGNCKNNEPCSCTDCHCNHQND